MAPKRPAKQVTPPPTKKSKTTKPAQPSIDTFFASPNKTKTTIKSKPNGDGGVITIDDSDDDILPGSPGVQEKEDGKLARKLAEEWVADRGVDKGKKKKQSRSRSPEVGSGGGSSIPLRIGVNGSSSSKKLLDPVAVDNGAGLHTPPAKARLVHPMFAGPSSTRKRTPSPTPMRDVKPEQPSPRGDKPAVITSTSAEAVKPIDFNTDAFLFRPAFVDVSNWPKGRLPYSVLVGVYVQVSSTRSRLTIVRVLTKYVIQLSELTISFLHLLIHASPIDLPPSLYLLSNHLLPSYLPCELGVGSQILSKAIQEVSGCQPRDLKKLWEKWGDPGDVAYEAKSTLRTLVTPAPLLVGDVYKRLLGLSRVKGSQSGKVKGDVVRKLMVQARGEEVRFLVRSLIGNLRVSYGLVL
jgi:DNA ligase-1